MKKGLFYKYFLIFASIITASIILLISLSAFFVGRYWTSEKFKMLNSNVEALTAVAKETVNSPDYTLEISRTGAAIAETSDSVVFFIDVNGNTFSCSDYRKNAECVHIAHTIDSEIMQRVMTDGYYSETGNLGGIYSADHYTVAMSITGYYDVYGAVFISCDANSQIDYLSKIIHIFVVCGVAILLITFVIIYIITNRLVDPLVQMSIAAKAMSKGDYSHRITVNRKDELGELQQSFNEMVQSVQSLEVMRSSFISNVSHELKTPMTTIGGFVDGILDGTIPMSQNKKYLLIVSDEVKRLSSMVNAMLSLSKLESGQTKLACSKVDITDIICRIIISFSMKIESKNIEIEGMEDVPQSYIYGDYDLLYQTIYNLFDNAIKFTPENGIISVDIDETNNYIKIKITNSGEGISEEDLAHIFERFYKSDKSRSMDKTGFGLGLHIVKSIVDIHNGKVSVESEYGKSTSFSITLPNINGMKQ